MFVPTAFEYLSRAPVRMDLRPAELSQVTLDDRPFIAKAYLTNAKETFRPNEH